MQRALTALSLALAGTTGCDLGQSCDLRPRPGIQVTVIDAETGTPVAGTITVTATHGSYTETVNVPVLEGGVRVARLAEERAGFYRVEVQASGYAQWVAPLVWVTEDECHVRTVDLTARLDQPEGV